MGFLSAPLLFVACAYLVSLSRAGSPCSNNQRPVAWIPDPQNCQGYFICVGKTAIPGACANGSVWQPEFMVCCLKGSQMDTCTESAKPAPKKFTIPEEPETCKPGMTKKLPHPKHCARYFDCAEKGIVRGLLEEQERECPHPMFFNKQTGNCEDQSQVDCEERTKPKDACDYEMNKCHRSHCIPCFVRFPSCAGLADGNRVWKGLEKTPRYAVCKDERVVKHGKCPAGTLFHPTLLVCDDAQRVQQL